MTAQDWYHCAFSGVITAMFNGDDEATIAIESCPVLSRGTAVTALKAHFAEQSFRTGVTVGDYVEGSVYKTGDSQKPYTFKHVTKII